MSPLHVGICGGGFSGMALAWHLVAKGAWVTVLDRERPGCGGASSVAAGILHPLTSRGKLIWKGEEGMEEALKLVGIAEEARGDEDGSGAGIIACQEILRPVMTAKQDDTFASAAAQNSQWLERLSRDEYLSLVPGASPKSLGAYRIKGAKVLNCPLYLESLWNATSDTGRAQWEIAEVDGDFEGMLCRQGGRFDAVAVTLGASAVSLLELERTRLVRGESLIYQNGGGSSPPLKVGILCGKYLMPNGRTIIAGATQEHILPSDLGNQNQPSEKHREELSDKVGEIFPGLSEYSFLGSTSGVRAIRERSSAGRLPAAGKHSPNVWALTALGARGLIHHAFLAKSLADCIMHDKDEMPHEVTLSTKQVGHS